MINTQMTVDNIQVNPFLFNLALSELEYSIDFEDLIEFDEDFDDIDDGNDIDAIFE